MAVSLLGVCHASKQYCKDPGGSSTWGSWDPFPLASQCHCGCHLRGLHWMGEWSVRGSQITERGRVGAPQFPHHWAKRFFCLCGMCVVLRDIMQMEVSILYVLERWPVLNTLVKIKIEKATSLPMHRDSGHNPLFQPQHLWGPSFSVSSPPPPRLCKEMLQEGSRH